VSDSVGYLDDLLATEERISLRAHRHVLFLVLNIGLYIAGAIALWALAFVAYRWVPRVGTWVMLVLLVASLIPLGIAVYRFLRWKLEEFAVTNYRIIQVEGILHKRTFDSALDKVNDVLMSQTIFGRMFGYGDIQIITGSEIGVNDLTGIADPFAFKRALLEAKMQPRFSDSPVRPNGREVDENRRERMIDALAELRDAGHLTQAEYEERRERLRSD
jgi:uncharacterized membrane protein YdbT with pleckstrin-like domain